ncbi:MAG: cyclophilin-like fold protein, partial [Desulfobacterales bacterium]
MPTPIVIQIDDLELQGELNDTPAGRAAAEALPFEWSGNRWGDEYYGPPSVDFGDHPGEKGAVMNVGDLGWHAPNQWFCLFFGPT